MKKLLTSSLIYQAIGSSLVLVLIVSISSFSCPKDKITICHIPPGNPANAHEITISQSALQTHLNHGDSMTCGSDSNGNTPKTDDYQHPL